MLKNDVNYWPQKCTKTQKRRKKIKREGEVTRENSSSSNLSAFHQTPSFQLTRLKEIRPKKIKKDKK